MTDINELPLTEQFDHLLDSATSQEGAELLAGKEPEEVFEQPTIGNTADVAYQLRKIAQLGEDVRQFKDQAREAAEFYTRKIEALEKYADFLKENVGRFLKANGLKKLATHSGTVYFTNRPKVILPDAPQLLAWIKDEVPEEHRGDLIKESPNTTAVKKYIESSGKIPIGYIEQPHEAVSIRKAA